MADGSMIDKRRRARIQGGWAATAPSNRDARRQNQPVTESEQKNKNKDATSTQKFSYEETGQVIKKRPPDVIIQSEGRHILTPTLNQDVCSVHFIPDFIDDPELQSTIFRELMVRCPWEEKLGSTPYGESFHMPRLVCWYGPLPYTFSNATLKPNLEWPSIVTFLHDQIKSKFGFEFNSVLVNLYRDGRDSVAWHSDDELLMGVHPRILSLSFGETRMFEMRQKLPKGESEENYEYVQHVKIPLKSGSLLIMEGATQSYWQHRIPKEYHDKNQRINLTFRTVFSL